MNFETIRIETDPRGVATLTLNRPEKRNALSAQMLDDLTHAAETLAEDERVRVVVLTGAGEAFCAGGDLAWMRQNIEASRDERRVEGRRIAGMLKVMNELPKPLIARIQGNAFGGGVGMACVSDTAIGVTGARFGLTETRLGLIPATIGPYVIARLGEGMARRFFLSSRLFDAAEAERLGVLARVAPPEALDTAVDAEIAPYLACAPGAVAKAKRLARRLGPTIDEATIEASIDALIETWEAPEALQGIEAFFAKHPAPWVV